MPRTDFTAQQKAEIFALDRATCTYSGRNLWIADYGADPSYQIDWADHVIPAARGGASSIENGAAAAYLYNYLRGKDRQRLALFHRGLPTIDHTTYIGAIDADVAARLERFVTLTSSEWFLNRAMWHVWLATGYEYQRRCGATRSRGYSYYSACAWKALTTWRRMVGEANVSSIEERGLGPSHAGPDQTALLEIRNATSAADIIDLMHHLFPAYEAAAIITKQLAEAGTTEDLARVRSSAESSTALPQRLRTRAIQYSTVLRRLFRSM